MRGRGEGKTYTKRLGKHEHRLVAEEKLGRPLRKEEVVHHIDGDYKNNDPNIGEPPEIGRSLCRQVNF